ncbi:hypothetical protein SHIRM173S_08738 [Streptomyces hirsutus]
MVDLGGGGREPRDDLAGGELQDGGDLFAVLGGHGDRVPVGVLHRLDQGAGLLLRLVGRGAGGGGLVETEGLAQAGQGGDAAPDLAGAQDRQDEVDPVGAGGPDAQDMEAVADLGVLDLAEPAVDVQEEVVEAVVVGAVVEAEVVVEAGGLDEGPDLGADRRELRRVHGGDLGVLVEELFQARDVAVGVGAGHRGDEVVDEGGVDPALGLGALARVVDQEGVDEGEVAEGGVGAAGGGQAGVLARQPLQVAVLAEVDHGVRAEAAVLGPRGDPAVGGEVVVGGRQVGVVVDGDGVLAEAARGLDEDQQVAAAQGGEDDVALRVAAAVEEHLARCRAPVLLDGRAQFLGEGGVPALVVGGRDAHRVAGELFLGEPVLVVAARLDQRADQFVAVPGGQSGDVGVAEVVSLVPQSAQQGHRAGGGVQADRVADAGVLGRVGGQDEGQALVGGRDVPQAGVAHGDAGHAGGALGVGDVGREAVGVDLLEGERHGDQAAVELGHGDLAGGVQRGDALVALLPGGAGAGQAQGLEDRHVQGGECARVPGLVVAAGGRLGGLGAAGREDGRDDDVRRAQLLDQFGFGGAQGGHVQRQGPPARVLHGVAQGVDEGGVAAHVMGAVVEHGDGRAVGALAGCALQRAPGGRGRGRVEAVAGEQDRVGQEAGELLEVGGSAVGEIGVRLRGDADGNRGGGHQLGVGGLFTGEDDDRAAVGEQQVEALLPGAQSAEETYDDQADTLEERGQVVEREAGGVGEAVGHRAVGRAGAEQVRVGCRQEQDAGVRRALPGRMRHASAGLPRDPRPGQFQVGVSPARAEPRAWGREFLTRPASWWPDSQWRDRAGFAPGFLPCRRRGDGGSDDPPRTIVRVGGRGQGLDSV